MEKSGQDNCRRVGHVKDASLQYCRREFMKRMGLATASAAVAGLGDVFAAPLISKGTPEFDFYRDRAMGCWLGAAIGDAMGGPVECQHYKRIERHYGDFTDFLPYKKPPGLLDLRPGYALYATPGSITDDTFIRLDLTRFYLHTEPPYTPAQLADYLLKHADFSNWWGQAVKVLRRIEQGQVSAEEAGLDHIQGGGGDADSIATNTASWLGAISGESVWPKKWRQNVQEANLIEVDLRKTLDDLLAVALKNGSVRTEKIMP